MRSIPSLLLADLKADCTTLAFVWQIELSDGRAIRGTEHDLDITIPPSGSSPPDKYAGTYYAVANVTTGDIKSSTDLSVDNLEVKGALGPKLGESTGVTRVLDLSVDDIESGIADHAPVSVLLLNWKAPGHGYVVMKSGVLGAINHDSDGRYVTEVRGLTQLLAQTLIRTFSVTCNVVKFGDHRCRYNVDAHAVTGVVGPNTSKSRQEFDVDLALGSPPSVLSYEGGEMTFTSGANAGFSREVKVDPNDNGGIVQFWDEWPEDVNAGDAFILKPGCDRTMSTCQNVYANIVHFRGYGVFIPGVNAITAGPTTVAEL